MEGRFNGGFLRYRFGGLIFGGLVHGGGLFSEFYGRSAADHLYITTGFRSHTKKLNLRVLRSDRLIFAAIFGVRQFLHCSTYLLLLVLLFIYLFSFYRVWTFTCNCFFTQYGRLYVETFLRLGMPVLDVMLRTHKVSFVSIGVPFSSSSSS